jgi:hypothetical protein
MAVQPVQTIKIFFCYAREDDDLRKQLAVHLSHLQRLRYITGWFDRDIQAGTDWEHEIETRLDAASIILLLISADFIASDYCYTVEMQRALEKQKAGTAHVIPIILRPTMWEDPPLSELQALPTGKKPITQWANQDEAWVDVVQGIRELVKTLLARQHLSSFETKILNPDVPAQAGQLPGIKPPQVPSPRETRVLSPTQPGQAGQLSAPVVPQPLVHPLRKTRVLSPMVKPSKRPRLLSMLAVFALLSLILLGSIYKVTTGNWLWLRNTPQPRPVSSPGRTASPQPTGQASTQPTNPTSSPGQAWTILPVTSNNPNPNLYTSYLKGITESGSQWVTVGGEGYSFSGGIILTSANEETWTYRSAPNNNLNRVAWSGTQWVAVGDGIILTSSNGETWTSQTFPDYAVSHLSGITWSGSQWIAVGEKNNQSGVILTSSDGKTWTSRSVSPSISGVAPPSLSGIACSRSQCVAVGTNTILTSSDGKTWISQTLPPIFAGLESIAWSGSQWVAVGDDSIILTSFDGKTWIQQMIANESGAQIMLRDIAWSGSQWMVLGGGIITSSDGKTWTYQDNLIPAGAFLYGIACSRSQCLAVGQASGGGSIILASKP